MANNTLEIRDVVKRHGKLETVCGVNLSLREGQRMALLGHNGAGKTTLIRMILGLTKVDGGSISVFGSAPGSDTARRMTTYLPESVAFHKALSGREQLSLFARLQGEPISVCMPLLERVGLADAADRRIGAYSKGMRQRLGLAQVLLGHPKLALLDEPTSGLDPISRQDFYSIVDDMAAKGTAVLISSHALTEIEARTDCIAILRSGHLMAMDSLANLRRYAGLPIQMHIRAAEGRADEVASTLNGTRVNGSSVNISCMTGQKMDHLTAITSLGQMVVDVDVIPPSLDDLYRHYATGGPTL
ncbi:MAG: ABC transporter ATP-binding protein [Rhodobacterales bacterium]